MTSLRLPAASVATTEYRTGMPSTSVIGRPNFGLSTAVSIRQPPSAPARVSQVTGPSANTVSVTTAPGSVVPENTGWALLVKLPRSTVGASGAVLSGDAALLPPPPPPAAAIASPPSKPSAGLYEVSASGAAGTAAASGPDAYIRKLPSAIAATGRVAGVISSVAEPPRFSRDSEQGSSGGQRVKNPSSTRLRPSGRSSTTRSSPTRLIFGAPGRRTPRSSTMR